ncbi:MAG TPA: hypothetical protein VFT24_13610 [Vicinamibacterales bacterium]|nr:hypothetical protein [Vicinamibacterales bacterium]
MPTRAKLALGLALLMGLPVLAVNTKFSNFTPLSSSAGPLPVDGPEEATPDTLPASKWSQRTVADRRTQEELAANSNSGSWDMITSNETGPDAGRYLFMPFETGTAGVQRIDLQNPHYEERTVTIVAPGYLELPQLPLSTTGSAESRVPSPDHIRGASLWHRAKAEEIGSFQDCRIVERQHPDRSDT